MSDFMSICIGKNTKHIVLIDRIAYKIYIASHFLNGCKYMNNLNELAFKQAKDRFNIAYYGLFSEIGAMLSKAKLMPIHALCAENPSFNKRAQELVDIKPVLEVLAPYFGVNYDKNMIEDYIELVVDLASAIDSNDPDNLGAAIAALDEKPYI
jgi:hypothetical protein